MIENESLKDTPTFEKAEQYLKEALNPVSKRFTKKYFKAEEDEDEFL